MAEKDPARTTTPGTAVLTLREYEQRHQELKDIITNLIEHERELREQHETSIAKANAIAITEIERRLGELNHAHAQAMENWARTLPRELFDSWQKEYDRWKDSVNTFITSMTPMSGDIKGLQGRMGHAEVSVSKLLPVLETVSALKTKVDDFGTAANKLQGALILLGLMGLAGVIAFVLGIARLAGVLTP